MNSSYEMESEFGRDNTSAQPSNHSHPETHSHKPSYSIAQTRKPVQHKTLQERDYSNEPLSQLQEQVAQKKLKKGSGQGEGQPSRREAQRLVTEEGPPSRETQRLATEQPVREKPSGINVDTCRSSLKEVHHFNDGGRSLRVGKEGVQMSAIQRTSVSHMSAGAAYGGSPSYSTGVSTPASQNNRKPLYTSSADKLLVTCCPSPRALYSTSSSASLVSLFRCWHLTVCSNTASRSHWPLPTIQQIN